MVPARLARQAVTTTPRRHPGDVSPLGGRKKGPPRCRKEREGLESKQRHFGDSQKDYFYLKQLSGMQKTPVGRTMGIASAKIMKTRRAK